MNCWQAAAAAAAAAEAGRHTDSSVASKLALAVDDAALVPPADVLVVAVVDDVFRLLAGCELNGDDWWCNGRAGYE